MPDLDLPLKLRLRHLLFQQGYWCPVEVELSHYNSQGPTLKRSSVTDLDVLGARYDTAFNVHHAVGDCKSGKNVSDLSRLFWIRGVMDYFEADHGYYLRPSIDRNARALAPKLNIRAVGNAELLQLEKSLNIGQYNVIPFHDPDMYLKMMSDWGFVWPAGTNLTPDEHNLRRAYSFVSYLYWYVDGNRRLGWLIDRFQLCAQSLDPGNARHKLLVQIAAERFAYCLMEIARNIVAQGVNDILQNTRIYLYGGPLQMEERQQLFALMQKVVGTTEELDPPWLPEVFELLNRIVRNPLGACDLLRHLMAIHFWCASLGNSTLPRLGPVENTAAIVLAKDVYNIFVKTTGVREAFFDFAKAL